MFEVLKPFKYAHNNIDITLLNKGDIVLIDESCVKGLTEEGFIKKASKAKIEQNDAVLETKVIKPEQSSAIDKLFKKKK